MVYVSIPFLFLYKFKNMDMKNITRFISENAETDLSEFIKNNLNNDYESALKILRMHTSYKGIESFISDYKRKTDEERKNSIPGKFIQLLENNNIDPSDRKTQRLLKSVYRNYSISVIDKFVNAEISFDKLISSPNNNIFDIISETAGESSNEFKDLLNFLFENIEYTKFGGNNGKIGEGELLLQLVTNKTPLPKKSSGDVCLPNNCAVEVKCTRSKTALGSSLYNSKAVSEQFLNAVWETVFNSPEKDNVLIKHYSNNLVTLKGKTYMRCFGSENANVFIQDILNNMGTFTEGKCRTLFHIYINTLFNQYGISGTSDAAETLFATLANNDLNPFKLDSKNKLSIDNLTNITGFVHLLAYKEIAKFDYMFVVGADGKYVILDFTNFDYNSSSIVDNILNMYNICVKNLKINPPESRGENSAGRMAVSSITGIK